MDIEWKRCSARTWVEHIAKMTYNGVVQQKFQMNSNLEEQKLSVRDIQTLTILISLKVIFFIALTGLISGSCAVEYTLHLTPLGRERYLSQDHKKPLSGSPT